MFTFIFTFSVVCKVPITPSGNFLLILSSLLMQTFFTVVEVAEDGINASDISRFQ